MPKKNRILAVDDNARNLAILKKVLSREFEFASAESGEVAIETAVRFRPDLILLDVMLPGMDGYETCRHLRSRPGLASTKIIMVSAKGQTSERLEGYAAGANDYMVKPFDPDELLAKVHVYVRLKSVEEVDRIKSDLLSLLNHETRTPLTFIMGPLSLLRDHGNLGEKEKALVQMAKDGAHRLLALVERVFFLSQLKSGSITLESAEVDLGAIAAEAAEEMGAKAEQAGVLIVVENDEPAWALGDPERLRWTVEALLDNAIRFSPQGEPVVVRVWSNGSQAGIAVTDRGPGVAPDVLPRLFEEFVASDIDHHTEGLGLSLATASFIVEQHGGALALDTAPSGGPAEPGPPSAPCTTFRISLPALTSPEPKRQRPAPAARSAAS